MEILPNGTLIDKITTYDEYLASDEMAKSVMCTQSMSLMHQTTKLIFHLILKQGRRLPSCFNTLLFC